MAHRIHQLCLGLRYDRFEDLGAGYVQHPVAHSPDDKGCNRHALQQNLQGRNVPRTEELFEDFGV